LTWRASPKWWGIAREFKSMEFKDYITFVWVNARHPGLTGTDHVPVPRPAEYHIDFYPKVPTFWLSKVDEITGRNIPDQMVRFMSTDLTEIVLQALSFVTELDEKEES